MLTFIVDTVEVVSHAGEELLQSTENRADSLSVFAFYIIYHSIQSVTCPTQTI